MCRGVVVMASLLAAVPVGAQVNDHLLCFKARDDVSLIGVVDIDRSSLGPQGTCRIGKARYYCGPAANHVLEVFDKKTGQSIEPSPLDGGPISEDRVCYKVKCLADPPPDRDVSDQFGTRRYSRFKASLLCSPAMLGSRSSTSTLTSTTSTTAPRGCFLDRGTTVLDSCGQLEWEKKDSAVGSGMEPGNLHDVDNAYAWVGRCRTNRSKMCQPNASAAATCRAQTRRTGECGECSVGDGPCDMDAGAITTIWDWVNQVNASGFAGHSDWRLPTSAGCCEYPTGEAAELESTMDRGRPGCLNGLCIYSVFGPSVIDYWSASARAGSLTAWFALFYGGGGVGETYNGGGLGVRAVRSP